MVVSATFNNISVIYISWRSVLLEEETGENHWPTASHNFLSLLQLPINSVPFTTKVVSLNPTHGELYLLLHYVIKFVSDMRQVKGFRWVLRCPPPIKLTRMIKLKYYWKSPPPPRSSNYKRPIAHRVEQSCFQLRFYVLVKKIIVWALEPCFYACDKNLWKIFLRKNL